jgi:hypothetical protein
MFCRIVNFIDLNQHFDSRTSRHLALYSGDDGLESPWLGDRKL